MGASMWITAVAGVSGWGNVVHPRDGQAVVAFDPHGVDGGHGDARFGAQPIEQPAHALDVLVVALRIQSPAITDDIVDNDQSPRSGALQGLGEILRVLILVG